ncbi:sulfite exporter TauE/SafE family protein [Rheinheimera sp. MMS21-TC3]|uniref:sulfite exporter TauE/SafE family protein n=1 Tax=Rheinheimera sp. MMS21-TC3 TaxID=3072790 RepID=UPI0028C5101B|nr:sulfite exporter TauE/SafE family protein [Rheinheimera sp. MMS21-TC3]WNO61850.1 sulfite exporter TauE/SafE family protein [Rheinheimera sp. MMS21-TC3]
MLTVIVLTLLLGAVVGFLAGLLGIGGGLLIVPALVVLLPAYGIIAPEHAMLVAIATSLASIIVTASSSVLAHHRRDNVPWSIATAVLIGAGIGASLVGYFAHNVSGHTLKLVFAIAVLLLSLRMLGSRSIVGSKALPNKGWLGAISALLAGIASLLGIGGGALFVPMLNYFSVDMRRAIGCAAASGIAISVFGSIGYVLAGWQHYSLADGFFGYIYLPVLAGIVATSAFMAPIGARLTQRLPVLVIKRVFGIFLILVAAKMMFS